MAYHVCPKCQKKGLTKEKVVRRKGFKFHGRVGESCKYCGHYAPTAGYYKKV